MNPSNKLTGRELEIATRAFRWALYAMADTCQTTGEPPGRVLNVILSEEGWEWKLKQKLETWLEIHAEVTEENARSANAETPQAANERREEPEKQATQCLWCNPPAPDNEPGAHHAADCILYRSPFVGPDAKIWDSLLCEKLGRANAETRQPANESREEPQHKSVQQKQASHE